MGFGGLRSKRRGWISIKQILLSLIEQCRAAIPQYTSHAVADASGMTLTRILFTPARNLALCAAQQVCRICIQADREKKDGGDGIEEMSSSFDVNVKQRIRNKEAYMCANRQRARFKSTAAHVPLCCIIMLPFIVCHVTLLLVIALRGLAPLS